MSDEHATQCVMLVCTVGGSPEAVAAAIMGCRPERVIFVPSRETSPDIESRILPLLDQEGFAITPGRYESMEVPDAQDFAGCVETIRRLDAVVADWQARGQGYGTVVDITGGTKCMSAALALVARRWRCQFSYVGGTERTKEGKGIVVGGHEQHLFTRNPWDALGYQAMEEATLLFDRGDYEAAAHLLEDAMVAIGRADLKRQLNALKLLSEAYLAWDLFDHRRARSRLADTLRNANDLRSVLPSQCDGLLSLVRDHMSFLQEFETPEPGAHHILDLCANAQRCAERGRFDDAVARLYRAVEAMGQVRLHQQYHAYQVDEYGPKTAKLCLDVVPEPLKTEWAHRPRAGTLKLALDDNYRLLEALEDDLGSCYREIFTGPTSPLSSRNLSILAHGFTPVGRKVFDELWEKTTKLCGIQVSMLPAFPKVHHALT